MRLIGTLKDIVKDSKGNTNVSFTITNYSQQEMVKELKEEKYSIEVKKYTDKRTIKQNRLLWELLKLIDEKISGIPTPDGEMKLYINALLKAGAKYEYVCCKENMANALREQFRAVEFIKAYNDDKETNIYRVYYGSSKMDKKEFELLVSAIKEMGYESGVEMDYWEEVLK